jgi:hypothetical protein
VSGRILPLDGILASCGMVGLDLVMEHPVSNSVHQVNANA